MEELKKKILALLAQYRIAERGHVIQDYTDDDGTIAVYGNINVPCLADCQTIARECGVEYKHDVSFDLFIFYLD